MSALPRVPIEQRALTEQDIAVLTFERDWIAGSPGKDEAIRSRLGISSTRFYQLLREILTQRAALEFDAMLVSHLQRLREARILSRRVRNSPPKK